VADVLTPEQRSQCMSQVRGKNTRLEVDFRKKLWAMGLRYRLGYRLLGKPDLVFVSAKVAVFVDGCFWHGCPIHGQQPKTNSAFWKQKLDRNKLRDQRVSEELAGLGWAVVRFWEHELKQEVYRCVSELSETIKKRKSGGPQTNTKKS
jgi:DNA mismatch endonuclease (patch repair protein)